MDAMLLIAQDRAGTLARAHANSDVVELADNLGRLGD